MSDSQKETAFTACLFLGGPMDGQLIPVEDYKNTYTVQQMLSREVLNGLITKPGEHGAFEFNNITYHREVLTERDKSYHLFTCLPETATRLGRLLLGYRSLGL